MNKYHLRSQKIWPYQNGEGVGDLAWDLAKKNVRVVLARMLVSIEALARDCSCGGSCKDSCSCGGTCDGDGRVAALAGRLFEGIRKEQAMGGCRRNIRKDQTFVGRAKDYLCVFSYGSECRTNFTIQLF